MNNRIMSFETVRNNGSEMSEEPRNDRPLGRGRPMVDGRDEASRERYYRLFLKKGTLL